METLAAHISAIFDLEGSTLQLLTIICGAAIYAIREKVSSVFVLLLVFPVAMLASMVALYVFNVMALYDIKKMGEWIIWTIVAGSFGNLVALGVAIGLAGVMDRTLQDQPNADEEPKKLRVARR